MLRWRILLGAGLIAALAGLMVLDHRADRPGTWLFGLALVAALGGAQEVHALLSAKGQRPSAGVVYGGALAMVASNAVWLFSWEPGRHEPLARLAWPALALSGTLLAVFIVEMRRFVGPGGVMVNAALALFGAAYVGLTLSFAVQLRLLGGPADGVVALAALITVVKMGDTGAYTVGRLIGRHRMAPVLSPGKTWEGGAAAIAFACLGSWLAFHLVPRAMGHTLAQREWNWLVFGVAVGAAGLVGDLAESLLKRDSGRKDSSTWVPGFGGVLDVLDSILFAAPVAYFCWWLGMT